MEIQTFFLAERITRVGRNRHDVQHAAISLMECTAETPFPCQFTLPALMVLRRESRTGNTPFTLRLDLVDEDGKLAGKPRRMLVKGAFPDGYWFFTLMAKIELEFPRPGTYRLDITPDEGLAGSIYHYAIDIVRRPEP
jgi:hypothetical protein